MRRSSPANSCNRGFSLAELLVASSVTVVVLSGICGVYFTIAREYERGQGLSQATATAAEACSRLCQYLSQATGVELLTRFTPNDAIAVNLPLDSPYPKVYAPVWSGGGFGFRSGSWIVFYLSDSTGSYYRAGNVLWAGTMTWSGFPASVVPDVSWSMYYNTTRGRTEGIKSIKFSVDSSGTRPVVSVTVVSSYMIGRAEQQVSHTRLVCLRNTN
ncbi:MAG: hypothetical protein QHI38_02570 [Armatimonadota bacterium]|nr:hypothetical protein [Armatimonadota bacterium]